jgi:hypothetical protein
MRCDEFVGDVRSLGTMEMVRRKIGRGEALHIQNMGSNPDAVSPDAVRKPKMLTGQYVPDEEHVQICLNCERKKCTGYCKDVRRYGKKIRKDEIDI